MSANMLKLNQDKTELIIFAPKHQVKHFSDFRLKFDGTVLSDVSFEEVCNGNGNERAASVAR
jgi:hypothetical protein